MRIGFVAGLSVYKLSQKLAPLQALPEVERILLFRREPYSGPKVEWQPLPRLLQNRPLLGDGWRFGKLLATAKECDLLIGCHQRFHGVAAGVVGYLTGVPTIQLVITSASGAWGVPGAPWVLRRAAAIGVRGRAGAAWYRQRLGETMPIFIPPNHLELPPLATAHTLPPESDVIFVGSFTAEKNLPMLVEVVTLLARRPGGVTVRIVGCGPLEGYLRGELTRRGLNSQVELLGWQPPAVVDELYSRSRILLLTSTAEGLPMVVAEALRWGVPAVVTAVGDVAELVTDGVNGFLIPSGDAAQAAARVGELLDHPELYQRLAQGARERYREFVRESGLAATTAAWRTLLTQLGMMG